MTSGKKDDKKLYMAGAHVWARWSLAGTPRYELYDFVGYNLPLDQYFFRSRRTGVIETKKMMALIDVYSNFRPFLLNMKVLDEDRLITIA